MARRLPPLNALRAFEAAARHLSFTRAAEELNVTQAAISHQVKALEEQLGLPLFRRLNRALVLTDEAQALFPVVRRALDDLAEALERLYSRNAAGALTVSVLPSFAVKWLVPRMSLFQDQHPGIDLRITAADRLVDFVRDSVDVAVRFGAGDWPGLRADFVVAEHVTPVCAPALAARLRVPDDLASMTLLHEEMAPIPRFPVWETWLRAAGAKGVNHDKGPRFSHTHIMLQAAIDGHGVALAQMLFAADDIAEGRLVAPFALKLPTGYAYYVVCLAAAADRPKIRAFREWVIAGAKGAQGACIAT
ncbi:MAG: transcriptional regulator GcvA [Rhodospirillales bacterium]|nr:transcriptional regulator GcvA [Rhodospirillales bacterium]